MHRRNSCIPGFLTATAVALVAMASTPASAQTACITPNCVYGGTPTKCVNRAAPRTPTVYLGQDVYTVYVPDNPKIEPGSCILWYVLTNTHSSSGPSCTGSPFCGSPSPSGCQWDTANLTAESETVTSTCYYDPALFPPASQDAFHCRFHITMTGTLQVTTPISVTLAKQLATNSVKLNWTGGGVAGDVSYKLERQSGGDPSFPAASTATLDPDGGVFGVTFTDVDALSSPTTVYYLVRNKQSTEP